MTDFIYWEPRIRSYRRPREGQAGSPQGVSSEGHASEQKKADSSPNTTSVTPGKACNACTPQWANCWTRSR